MKVYATKEDQAWSGSNQVLQTFFTKILVKQGLPINFTIEDASANVSLVFIFNERTSVGKPREKG